MTYRVGVTGTREGSTEGQFEKVKTLLEGIILEHKNVELHHGDCLGVDVEIAMLAQSLGFRIVCHPPTSDYLRAFHQSDEIREPFGYLKRDRNIVDSTDFLIVVPLQQTHQKTGGTWYTHDYAIKQGKKLVVFHGEK